MASRGSSVAPCAPVARKGSTRARRHQLCRGRAAPAAVGAATKECVVPQRRSKLFAPDLQPGPERTSAQSRLRKRTASHAMPRQRASLPRPLSPPFLGKAKVQVASSSRVKSSEKLGKRVMFICLYNTSPAVPPTSEQGGAPGPSVQRRPPRASLRVSCNETIWRL